VERVKYEVVGKHAKEDLRYKEAECHERERAIKKRRPIYAPTARWKRIERGVIVSIMGVLCTKRFTFCNVLACHILLQGSSRFSYLLKYLLNL
jgi:hypothetical protein